jgi:aminocarboxymuconate-semialdehyde decarboxylase
MAKSEIIDVHAHIYPDGCFAEVLKGRMDFKLVDGARGRTLVYRGSHVMSTPTGQDDLAKRLASMDEAGIDVAVLSVGAVNVGWAGARDAAAAQVINDGLAAACRQHPSRFRFVAVLPCTSEAEMVRELDRALGLGASGVGIATRIGDFELCAREVRHFWREMHRRKLMVLVHPTYPCEGPPNDPGTFLAVGYPGETAMAATKLALAGVLAECSDVQIVWSHLGGSLPMVLDRIDRGYQRFSACPEPPGFYLRRCYYDTVSTNAPALACARAAWGVDRLVFGTDVPHVANAEKETVAAVRSTAWSAAELDNVFAGTARKLMG